MENGDTMTLYIALLRGINVGGNNKIKMAELKAALGELGLARVQTYIQSGNLLFESDQDEVSLRLAIEQQIKKSFGLSIKTIIRTFEQWEQLVERCPFTEEQLAGAAAASQGECFYVALMLEEPSAERVEKLHAFKSDNDQFQIVGKHIYLLYNRSILQSKLPAQVEKLGVLTTTRNWKTVMKLAAMANEMRAGM